MPSDLQVSNIKDLTGSNTGLSIASDGQVTISQNNPTIQLGSNATFPGPPSAGTFNGGHIKQITTNSSTTPANGTGAILAVSHSITMSDSSNKLLVFATMQFQISGGAGNARYAGTQLVTSGSGVTAQTYKQTVSDGTGSYGFRWNHTGFNDSTFGLVVPINYLFSPAYEGTVTVTANMLGYASSNGTIYTNVNDSTHSSSTIMLMEVVA